ncbi:hypothetical protein [Knoellia koreensis]|uniref:Uncharacterized protein n=1 Tax=Knoellia koreensis TaxID=2730921 RepID=A0A849H416_9MICO|nr:hypothetical protein [Knoellia sp. DB2414S]NNM44526.1 hypothetical protein [Knoellia sp. DB2414S]
MADEYAAWQEAREASVEAHRAHNAAVRAYTDAHPAPSGDARDLWLAEREAATAHERLVARTAERRATAAGKAYVAAQWAAWTGERRDAALAVTRERYLDADARALEALEALEEAVREREALANVVGVRPETSRTVGRGHFAYASPTGERRVVGLDQRLRDIGDAVRIAPRDLVRQAAESGEAVVLGTDLEAEAERAKDAHAAAHRARRRGGRA